MRTVMDRSIGVGLALLGACGLSVAFADTPPEPAAASPAAATAAAEPTTTGALGAPATAATPNAAATATPVKAAPAGAETDAALEKRLTNSGYKPRTRNGTKVWCKREAELGSRLGGQEVCGTPDELRMSAQQHQDAVRSVQKLYNATAK
jgi:hypothetical protein